MATVPTFDTFAAGEVVTEAKMNKNVRDAGNFFRSMPACVMAANVAQSIPTGTAMQTVTLALVNVDSDAMADLANNRIVIKTAGVYALNAGVGWAANATGFREVNINAGASGAPPIVAVSKITALSGFGTYHGCSAVVRLAVNDVVQLKVAQNSGVALSTAAVGGVPVISAYWIGA